LQTRANPCNASIITRKESRKALPVSLASLYFAHT
jgi:hypothetical protein